jgi:SAM-dependent methyltransferase
MATTAAVYEYWERQPCGTVHAASPAGTHAYYSEIEAARYGLEPFIFEFADFPRWRGRRVLEIGVGAGSDFVNFARAGAHVSGIDLTPSSIEHTRCRLELEGLQGEVTVADGESLPYPDGSFDLVYSWGVIHHAERPANVIREARRVLAADGEMRAMLYGRHSWVAFALWIRHALLAGRPRRSLADVVASHMESPGTRAYTRSELELLFAGAGFDRVEVAGLPNPYDRRIAGPLAGLVRLDWFLGVRAR